MSVIIDQFRISDNGQVMHIDAHVSQASYFDDVYISKVTVCTEEQVSELCPECPSENYIWQETCHDKEVHFVLCKESFNDAILNSHATEAFDDNDLSHRMFFLYIECTGTPSQDTPCALDSTMVAVTFDYGMIFNPAMNYTKELADSCNVSKDFIDFILNVEALKLSVETEHWIPAISYWKGLVNGVNIETAKPCGCHG